MENIVTPERLRERLHYDPETGLFHRRLANGTLAGPSKPDKESGYVSVTVDYQTFRAGRAAWAYVYGEWPDGLIDHINGDRSDNRIANLRVVTPWENSQNRQGANRTRVIDLPIGVYPGSKSTYIARICVRGQKFTFCGFKTPEEAHAKYMEVRRAAMSGNTL